MPYTISNNLDATKAALGEQSQGALNLQKSLNALGAGLKEDSQYGPMTQAAFAKYGASLGAPSSSITPANDQQVQDKNALADSHNAGAPAAPGIPAPAAPGAPAPVVPPAAAPAPVAAPAAPAATPAPALNTQNQVLQMGSKGVPVSTLQSLLGITADGNYGPQTAAAVKAFQVANGLATDGIVGPQTLAALNKSKSGPSATSNVAAGAASANASAAPNGTAQPNTTIKTGNASIDSLINILNNQSPQKSFSDIYKEVYNSLGLSTMKTSYDAQTKEFTDLQNKKNEEKDEINNNPWYSEGVRINKLRQLDNKYEGRETILTNKLKLLESNISNARSDAQFVSGKMLDQLNQSHKLTDDVILKAIDIAEKQADAESKLIEVNPGNSLVNKDGKVVYTAPETPGSIPKAKKDAFVKYGNSLLEKSRGEDGYVDPYTYKEAYNGWVNGYMDASGVKQPAIGTATEFITKFPPAKYVNPAASSITNLLPSFLQNKTKSTARAI